jgi:serine/threonine-protein kinase
MEGLIYNQLNERRLAEASYSEAISISKSTKGDVNAKLPRLYADLAESQHYLQEFVAAEQSYRSGLEIARNLKGEEDMDTIQLESRLGYFLSGISRIREGLAHIKHAMELVLKTMGAEDPWYTPMIAELYGFSLARSGELEDGLHYLAQATTSYRKNRPESAYILSSLERQASVLVNVGRYSEAQNLLDEAAAIRNKLHDETTNLNGNVSVRSELLAALGKGGEAAEVLERFHIENVAAGQTSLTWVQASIAKAEADLAASNGYEAVNLAARVRDELERGPSHAYFKNYEAQAVLAEGKGLLLLHRPADAVHLVQRAVALSSELYDRERSPVVADAKIAMANCLADLGERTQAAALLAQAKAIHATHRELGEQYRRPLRELEARLQHG